MHEKMIEIELNEDEIELINWALDIAIESPYVSGMFCKDMERIKIMLETEMKERMGIRNE